MIFDMPVANARSAPRRFGTSAAAVNPSIAAAPGAPSAASANCGGIFAGTNDVTSISGMPAATARRHHASFWSVVSIVLTSCSPSLSPTSRTSACSFIIDSFSATAENRLATLVVRGHAFVAILRRYHAVVCLDLECETIPQRHLRPAMDRLLRLPNGDRSVLGDATGRRQRRIHQLRRSHHLVHEAPGLGLFRGERKARQDDFLGPARTERAREVLG